MLKITPEHLRELSNNKMKTEVQLLSQVYAFNKSAPVGSRVKIKMDIGEIKVVTVKSPATILGGHTAVGWFEEISGCYSLDKIQP